MIIVEGMDNSGKSTLCKKLSLQFGITINSVKERLKTKDECIKYQLDSMFSPELKIYDRMRVTSEMVYGEILRENLFKEDGWYYISILLRCNPLIIYCRPPVHQILNFGERGQMDGVIEESSRLLERYDKIMKEINTLASSRIVYYNWDNLNTVMSMVSTYSNAFMLRLSRAKELQEKENEARSNRSGD